MSAYTIEFSDVKIGVQGTIVEVDEKKPRKQENHRGHRVKNVWVAAEV